MTSQRRLSAIMFTDIVGYSALTQENEALALELLNEHFTLLRPIIPEYDGDEIKTMGDSFLVEFASPLQAVKCAIEFQRALRKRNLDESPDRQIQIRIGIHVGDVEHVDGDVIGDGVNITSRIEPLAEPGGIALTRQVYDHVHNKIDFELKSLGAPQLKNITTIVEIYKVDLKWESTSSAELVRTKAQRRDNLLKIGSVVAVAIIAVAAGFFMWQSISAPPVVHLESGEITSIAVLPFEDLSENQDQEYFSEGLADEMRNALVKVEGLRVPSYTSSTSGSLKDLSLKEIAALMDVEAILEGTVRKSGDRLVITAKFIRASDDTQLWSESFNKLTGDIFEIQEEIAVAIVQKLGFRAPPDRQIVEAGTENAEAYNLYIQGRYLWSKRSEEGLASAIDYFKRAIELDPDFAQAYVGLADAYHNSASRGFIDREYWEMAKELTSQALEINPELAEGYAALGWIAYQFEHDFEAAESSYLKSLELNPNYATAHHWYRILLNDLGRRDEAIHHAELAVILDPLSSIIRYNYAGQLFSNKKFDEAEQEFVQALMLEPNNSGIHAGYSFFHLYLGNPQKSIQILANAIDNDPDNGLLHGWLGDLYRTLRMFNLAEEQYDIAIGLLPESRGIKYNKAILSIFWERHSDALAYIDSFLSENPDAVGFWLAKCMAHYYLGEFSDSLNSIESGIDLLDDSEKGWRSWFESYRAAIHAREGNIPETLNTLVELETGSLVSTNSPLLSAIVYSALGYVDNTLSELELAFESIAGDWIDIFGLPDFQPYRDQPRFRELFQRISLERNDQ